MSPSCATPSKHPRLRTAFDPMRERPALCVAFDDRTGRRPVLSNLDAVVQPDRPFVLPIGGKSLEFRSGRSCREPQDLVTRLVDPPPHHDGFFRLHLCSSHPTTYRQRRMAAQVHIIGGGLAGSEAAWQLAEAGIRVRLSEMRGGGDMTPAHETDRLAEMVCSNSFRSDDAEHNAVGLLHQEMRALGSLIMRAADKHRVPAGSALAVDREEFAAEVTQRD